MRTGYLCLLPTNLASQDPQNKYATLSLTLAHLVCRLSTFHRPATPFQRGLHGHGRTAGQPESGRAIAAAAYSPVCVRDGQEQNLGVDSGSFSHRHPEDEGVAEPLGMVCSRRNGRRTSVARAHHGPHHG